MPRYKFRLSAGQHVQADKSQKPITITDPITGEKTEKYPSKQYNVGAMVESDTNLAARFGQDKFELIGDSGSYADPMAGGRTPGDPTPEIAATSPAVAPGGQVSTGFQANIAGKSGPMPPEMIERFTNPEGAQQAEKEVNYEAMTMKQLHDYADEEEINLHGARSKEDAIKAIQAAKAKK